MEPLVGQMSGGLNKSSGLVSNTTWLTCADLAVRRLIWSFQFKSSLSQPTSRLFILFFYSLTDRKHPGRHLSPLHDLTCLGFCSDITSSFSIWNFEPLVPHVVHPPQQASWKGLFCTSEPFRRQLNKSTVFFTIFLQNILFPPQSQKGWNNVLVGIE